MIMTKRKQNYHTELEKAVEKVRGETQSVSSFNRQGKLCRRIKSNDLCFCGHTLKNHSSNLICTSPDCVCNAYRYIPGISLKCVCKHSAVRHNPSDLQCRQCESCFGFTSSWTCACGDRLLDHSSSFSASEGIKSESKSKEVSIMKETPIVKIDENQSQKIGEKLPKIDKSKGLYHAIDAVKQSRVREEIQPLEQDKQNEQQVYLKEKLRKANQRYLAKLSNSMDLNHKRHEQTSPYSALALYLQPHFHRDCPLSKAIQRMRKPL